MKVKFTFIDFMFILSFLIFIASYFVENGSPQTASINCSIWAAALFLRSEFTKEN